MSMQIVARIPFATFDAALAQDAGLNVDVGVPLALGQNMRLIVQGIVIVAEENLAWDILFWNKAVHGATYDTDQYIGHWPFQTTDAIQYSNDAVSGAFRYQITGLGLPYQDLDTQVKGGAAPKLHITLVPRGAAHVIHKKLSISFDLSPEVPWSGA